MKKILINTFLLLLVGMLFAQSKSGKIFYTVKHNWVKKIQAVDYMSQSEKERVSYVWGDRAEYKQSSYLLFNAECSFYQEEENDDPGRHSGRTNEYMIFRNHKENSTYDVIRMLDKLYVIKDSIQYPKWKILNDLKEIEGHMCMNATHYDSIKMSKVVAWFALDWPQNIGPERYGGLPGVILEVDVNNGAKLITANSVEIYSNEVEISTPKHKKRVTQILEEEYKKIISDFITSSKEQGRPYFWSIRD